MGFWNDGYSTRPRHSSRTSSYSYSSSRARPRSGYVNRMIYQIRKFIRDLYHYARRHPVKVFMVVIMPLLTGGALHRILAQFGVRLPPGLMSMFGGGGGGRGGGGFREYERFEAHGDGGMGGMGGVQGLIGLAKMFM